MTKIGVVQLNPTVGDLEGNVDRCLNGIAEAAAQGADLIVLPEMAVTGCHPLDILLDAEFIEAVQAANADLAAEAAEYPPTIVGTILPGENGLLNAAVLLENGTPRLLAAKRRLPNIDVAFESRWFAPGPPTQIHQIAGIKIIVLVGGDLEPATFKAAPGLIVNLAAAPFTHNAWRKRIDYAASLSAPLVFANLVGGSDALIFDGRSFVLHGENGVVMPGFEETVRVIDLAALPKFAQPVEGMVGVKKALVLGIRDFAQKNHIQKAFVGLSGGIDSSVVAALAAEALGPENLTGIAMPSRHTDPRSTEAAAALAKNLSIGFEIAPIEPLHAAAEKAQPTLFGEGVGAENVQARLRMLILMGYVNQYGGMLLNTGNKTEAAVGYATLYGDTAGTICPIADLTKPQVYQLARQINSVKNEIPAFSLERPPSAELHPGQIDPFDYDKVAPEFEALVQRNQSNPAMRAAEHKRAQSGIVLKVSEKAFGSGRMIPITRK